MHLGFRCCLDLDLDLRSTDQNRLDLDLDLDLDLRSTDQFYLDLDLELRSNFIKISKAP